MLDAFVYDGLRSPFDRHGGALAGVRPDDLAAQVIEKLVARSSFPVEMIEDVILGNVCQSGEDSRNVARFAGLLAGLPVTVGGLTVNRLCGSSMAAALDAARSITLGEAPLYIAGGVESMTRAPFAIAKSAQPWQRSSEIYDTAIGTRFPNPKIAATYGDFAMPETADNLAVDYDISRDAADAYAFASQQRFEIARARGFFDAEITPIDVAGRRGAITVVAHDEHPRPETHLEKISAMRPLYDGGVTTAANASGVNDGAAMLMIGAATDRAKPMGRIISGAVSGVQPRVMGIGPAHAVPKALERAGLTLADMDLIEINEAFATQVLACCKHLGLDETDSRLNPHGGAIAVGHPLGASGARIILTALRNLQETGGKYACLSMCIGVGQGIAMIVEATA